MKRFHFGWLAAASFVLTTAASITSAVAAPPAYHVVAHYKVSKDGGWDYLTIDSAARRLYIAHGTVVTVMNIDSGKEIGEIPNTQGVHGVAIAAKLGKGFTSNGRDNSVSVFDLKTLKETSRIKVGENPDAILYDPYTNRVFTFNGRSSDISVVDVETEKVLGTIPVGGKPEFCATDNQGKIFCNIEDKSELLAIDPKAMTVLNHYPLAPAEEPTGLAFDVAHHMLFAVCGNEKMAIVNSETGKVVATPTIGKGTDAAAFDPARQMAISSNGEGTLTIVPETAPGKFGTPVTVQTARGARTMALDTKTGRIFLITAKYGAAAPGERRPSIVPGSTEILVVAP